MCAKDIACGACKEVKAKMFGWMTLFGMMSVSGAGMALAGSAAGLSASIVFGILFVLGLCSRVLRRRSW